MYSCALGFKNQGLQNQSTMQVSPGALVRLRALFTDRGALSFCERVPSKRRQSERTEHSVEIGLGGLEILLRFGGLSLR